MNWRLRDLREHLMVHVSGDVPTHSRYLCITSCGLYFRIRLYDGDTVTLTGMPTDDPTTCLWCVANRKR